MLDYTDKVLTECYQVSKHKAHVVRRLVWGQPPLDKLGCNDPSLRVVG